MQDGLRQVMARRWAPALQRSVLQLNSAFNNGNKEKKKTAASRFIGGRLFNGLTLSQRRKQNIVFKSKATFLHFKYRYPADHTQKGSDMFITSTDKTL